MHRGYGTPISNTRRQRMTQITGSVIINGQTPMLCGRNLEAQVLEMWSQRRCEATVHYRRQGLQHHSARSPRLPRGPGAVSYPSLSVARSGSYNVEGLACLDTRSYAFFERESRPTRPTPFPVQIAFSDCRAIGYLLASGGRRAT